MKVLFIRANPVNPDSRVEKEIRTLAKNGYDVSLLAWDRNADYELREEQLNEQMPFIQAYRVGIQAPYGSGLKNLRNILKYQKVIHSFLQQNSFDIVHACDFDTAFTAYHTIDHKKTKFVYDIFDYYADAFNVPGIMKRLIVFLDRRIINGADLTILCTEERKKQIAGSSPKSLIIIHNTPDETLINNGGINNYKKTRICYVGILQPGRLLQELGSLIKSNSDYELHIGGFGIYEDYFRKLSNECDNIYYYGKIPYNKTLELEASCDIMLAIYDPKSRNHQYAAPNKFYEALMLGKPLIMVHNTGMANIVEQNGIGSLIDYSIDGLRTGLQRIVEDKKSWKHIALKEKELYANYYSWNIMEDRLVAGYQDLCGSKVDNRYELGRQ